MESNRRNAAEAKVVGKSDYQGSPFSRVEAAVVMYVVSVMYPIQCSAF